MADVPPVAYASPSRHAAAVEVIRRHSTNPRSLPEVGLAGMDLSRARQVLDLGCGLGVMSEAVLARCAPGAEVLGLDACPGNREPFLRAVARTGRRGRFTCTRIGADLPALDRSLDVVIAAWSLYFFVEVLPEIARVLREDGVFLAVTHDPDTLGALLDAAGIRRDQTPLARDLARFHSGCAEEVLAPFFAEVERVDYPNSLAFGPGDLPHLLAYLEFKLPRLVVSGGTGQLPGATRRALAARLATGVTLVVSKDDAVFRCRRPR